MFFEPRPARRFVHGGQALLNFELKSAPKEPVELEVLDPDGKTIRKLEAKGRDGINRVKWDLHYESPRLIALRTAPSDDEHIWIEPRFRDADSRPITHWGIKPAEVGPMVAPGKYSVRLTVAGQSFTQALTVLPDPRISTPESGIEESVKTQLRIRDDITQVSDTVNQIEWLRKQIEVIAAMLRPPKKKESESLLRKSRAITMSQSPRLAPQELSRKAQGRTPQDRRSNGQEAGNNRVQVGVAGASSTATTNTSSRPTRSIST